MWHAYLVPVEIRIECQLPWEGNYRVSAYPCGGCREENPEGPQEVLCFHPALPFARLWAERAWSPHCCGFPQHLRSPLEDCQQSRNHCLFCPVMEMALPVLLALSCVCHTIAVMSSSLRRWFKYQTSTQRHYCRTMSEAP